MATTTKPSTAIEFWTREVPSSWYGIAQTERIMVYRKGRTRRLNGSRITLRELREGGWSVEAVLSAGEG